jgi:hypothetical protein
MLLLVTQLTTSHAKMPDSLASSIWCPYSISDSPSFSLVLKKGGLTRSVRGSRKTTCAWLVSSVQGTLQSVAWIVQAHRLTEWTARSHGRFALALAHSVHQAQVLSTLTLGRGNDADEVLRKFTA